MRNGFPGAVNLNVLVISLVLSLLIFMAPIWWVLWRSGWRGYLKILNPWPGILFELFTALLLSLGMNMVFPQLFGWLFEQAREWTGNYQYVIMMHGYWPWYVYLYPPAVAVFLGYLWKNRNRGGGNKTNRR